MMMFVQVLVIISLQDIYLSVILQINTLYTLNLYSALDQVDLNKAGEGGRKSPITTLSREPSFKCIQTPFFFLDIVLKPALKLFVCV